MVMKMKASLGVWASMRRKLLLTRRRWMKRMTMTKMMNPMKVTVMTMKMMMSRIQNY
jgi:hypothetical protein